jgi:predicted acyltransferase
LLKLVPVPGFGTGQLDSLGNITAYVDRLLLGTNHLWPWGLTPGHGVTFDPEGLLSTLPATASLLFGVIAGEWLLMEYSKNRKVLALAGVGLVLAFAGWVLHPLLPINKKLWTSTFALFSGGLSLLIFSALYSVLDIKRWRWCTPPALVFGTNAILAFALSNVITTLTDRLHIKLRDGSAVTLHEWGYHTLFATWLNPVHASLAYALAIVILNMALVYSLSPTHILASLSIGCVTGLTGGYFGPEVPTEALRVRNSSVEAMQDSIRCSGSWHPRHHRASRIPSSYANHPFGTGSLNSHNAVRSDENKNKLRLSLLHRR